jgi:hydrogenase-4 component F
MSLEETSEIGKVRALLARRPALGGVFGAGLLALLGLPPFSLFMSELLMARAEFEVGLGWAAIVAFAAMAVVFVAVAGHAKRMLLGTPGEIGLPTMSFAPACRPKESFPAASQDAPASVMVPLVGGLVACAAIGVLVWPLGPLLQAAARVVSS